eukprot:UN10628
MNICIVQIIMQSDHMRPGANSIKGLGTTLLYPHRKGGKIKNSLKYLSSQWLRETIQQGSGGHDSIVDALAALKLTMKKIVHGPKYGIT